MAWKTVTYHREKLYEEVWAEPKQTVAARYGISDVGLAKICRLLKIPLPGRGYWMKKKVGREPKRPKLPALKPNEVTEYHSRRFMQEVAPPDFSDLARRQMAYEETDEARIIVPDVLDSPHPLVRQSRSILRRAAKPRSTIDIRQHRCLNVTASEAVLDRALRVADALIKALEARGFTVDVTKPDIPTPPQYNYGYLQFTPSKTHVLINEDWIEFGIEEENDPIPRAEFANSMRQGFRSSGFYGRRMYERRPNGKLALKIKSVHYGDGFRSTWSDGKAQRVENCLNKFIVGLITVSEAHRLERVKDELARRQKEGAEQKRQEKQKRREAEARLIYDLNSRIADWRRASAIREFVDVVERNAPMRQSTDDPNPDLARWIGWARRRAIRLESVAVETVLRLRQRPSSH